MGFFKWLIGSFRRKDGPQEPEGPKPWDRHPSIYEHIKAHIRPGKKGLSEGGETLPDEERLASDSELRWAPGATDQVLSRSELGAIPKDQAAALLDLVRVYCKASTAKSKLRVYEYLMKDRVINLVDPFLESLATASDLDHRRLHKLAKSFATGSPDREPTKMGIAILGLFRGQQSRSIFLTLGRHEEFTLYCAVALANTSESAEDDLWQLARNVSGWGRISTVERLADTENPRIKDWLLREGYRNSVMYAYLAHTCASKGGLRAALEKETIDDGLLTSAGEIIEGLLGSFLGPVGMDHYDDGAAVVEAYLKQLASRARSLPQFITVSAIKDWLSSEHADWEARESKGWTDARRTRLLEQCSKIMSRPFWRETVMAGLTAEDESVFDCANRAAQVLGIDTWQYHWDRLRESPRTPGRWFNVMRACTNDRIAQVVALAEKALPLDEMANGPGTEMGLGQGYEAHSCLDFILQDLGRFPGHGNALVAAGLRSPVIRNRNMALKVLSQWGKSNWPKGMAEVLEMLLSKEPDNGVRESMQKVIEGKPLDH